jgi:hypothetical protein
VIQNKANGSPLGITPKQREKMPGGITGKGFVKGDPRCNRSGRPKSFDQARALAQEILHRELQTKDGKMISVIEAILTHWAKSKEHQKSLLELAFGKVPDKIETDLTLKTKHIMHWPHERPDLVSSNGSRS